MDLQEFKELVKDGKVLVDFYAEWCGPCKMLMPILDELAEEGHKIIKVDVDESKEVTSTYGIMSVPTLVLFVDGEPTKRLTGFQPKELIQDLIEL